MNSFYRVMTLALTSLSCSLVAARPYTLDLAHTSVHFAADHYDRTLVRGRFNKLSGALDYDEQTQTGRVDITVEPDSVDTGIRVLDGVLKSEQFFHVAEHTFMRFSATRFHFDGEQMRAVEGELTVHGVTQPLTLTVNRFSCGDVSLFNIKRHVCGGDFSGTLKRSAFGMRRFLPEVGDNVKIFISVEASPDTQ